MVGAAEIGADVVRLFEASGTGDFVTETVPESALQAQLQQQEVQLRYYTVAAPTGGIVGDVPVRVGSPKVTTNELASGIGLNVGYYRTWYGGFLVEDNLAASAADFDEFCITAPTDSRLGPSSGRQICGLYDVRPALFGRVDNLVTQAANYGQQSQVYDGVVGHVHALSDGVRVLQLERQPAYFGDLVGVLGGNVTETSPAIPEEEEADDLEHALAGPRVDVADVPELLEQPALDAGLLRYLPHCCVGGALTASDDPWGYTAHGAPPAQDDNGTITPTAAASSIVFAPDEVIPTLHHFYNTYGANLFGTYGFKDAFHLGVNWWDTDYLGIDQGPIIIMIENYRSEFVWNVMKRSPYLTAGLCRAGFRGGWLEGRCQ